MGNCKTNPILSAALEKNCSLFAQSVQLEEVSGAGLSHRLAHDNYNPGSRFSGLTSSSIVSTWASI
jgi:hypothetical protein